MWTRAGKDGLPSKTGIAVHLLPRHATQLAERFEDRALLIRIESEELPLEYRIVEIEKHRWLRAHRSAPSALNASRSVSLGAFVSAH